MPSEPPNVIIFGKSAAGKSSLVNMLAGETITRESSGAKGCTLESTQYAVPILGRTFYLYDTAGLNEPSSGAVPIEKAIVQLYRLLRSLETGVSLLIYCVRGPRIESAIYRNWRLFHEIICQEKVPTILAITGLEFEQDMDAWWVANKGDFQEYGIFPQGVACITATKGKQDKHGRYKCEEEYEESKVKLSKLIAAHHLVRPWRVEPVQWFKDIVTVSYESQFCHRAIKHRDVARVIGNGVQQLMGRCEIEREDAERLGNLLADGQDETSEEMVYAGERNPWFKILPFLYVGK